MKTTIELIVATIKEKDEAEKFIELFSNNNEETINGSCGLRNFNKYVDWLDYIEKIKLGIVDNMLSSEVFWIKNITDNKIVGIIDIRHSLTKEKYKYGHIGLSIIPEERKQGFARQAVELGYKMAKEFGNKIVVISCNKYNIASKTMIMNSGFHYTKTIVEDNGREVLLFEKE